MPNTPKKKIPPSRSATPVQLKNQGTNANAATAWQMTNPHTASFLIFKVPFPFVGLESLVVGSARTPRRYRGEWQWGGRMRAGSRPRPFALGLGTCHPPHTGFA